MTITPEQKQILHILLNLATVLVYVLGGWIAGTEIIKLASKGRVKVPLRLTAIVAFGLVGTLMVILVVITVIIERR